MEDREPLVLTFSKELYSIELIKKAAYRLSAAFSFQFGLQSDDIVVSMFPTADLGAQEREEALHRFRTELLDQDLRAQIASETQAVRNAVLAHAFSRTGLQGEQVSEP